MNVTRRIWTLADNQLQAEIVEALPTTDFTSEPDNLKIAVVKADGEKCPRCWNYSTHIGKSTENSHICDRCVSTLAGIF